jgi:hypothetical protein
LIFVSRPWCEETAPLPSRQVSSVRCTGRPLFDHDPSAVAPLLSLGGGEAIRGGPDTPNALAEHGTPSIVVAQLDLSGEGWSSYPELPEVLAATLQGGRARADVHWRRDIAAADIVGIWQPGDPEYDRHPALCDITSLVDPI